MEPWQILALIGVGLAVAEFFAPSFFALPAGIAFLVTATTAAFTQSWTILLAALGLNLLVVYGVFYRFVWPKMQKDTPKTGYDAMTGKVATVTEPIVPGTDQGYVKLYGDRWRAISDRAFSVGDRVRITGIDGNKVVVEAESES